MYFNHGYALLIGANVNLPIVERDAQAIYDILVDERRAAYPRAQVDLLTKGRATRKDILEALDKLRERISSDPDATVFVYYSGHGGRFEEQGHAVEYYLIPEGYDPSNRSGTAVSGAEFAARVEEVASLARKLMVFLDCCHAAGIPGEKEETVRFVKSPVPPQLVALEAGSGIVIVASSHEKERSYYGNHYSHFTECLLEAMRGKGNVTTDGYARILDTLVYLFDSVPARAAAQGPQHPFVKEILDLGDNFPICFYAGGDKALPEAPSLVPEPPLDPSTWEDRRRREWLEILENERELRIAKVRHIREFLPIALDAIQSFSLRQHLFREEAELSRLEEQIRAILTTWRNSDEQ